MIAPDITTVNAPLGFWNDFLTKSFQLKNYREVLKIKDNEIVICSDKCKDVLEEILRISKEYPGHEFRVKTENGDSWNNLVRIYKCKDGYSKLIFEGYEYCFVIKVKGEQNYDIKELEEFKRKLGEFYQRVNAPNPKSISIEIPLDLCKYELRENIEDLTYVVAYHTKTHRFEATRHGLTFVDINISLLRPWNEYPEK